MKKTGMSMLDYFYEHENEYKHMSRYTSTAYADRCGRASTPIDMVTPLSWKTSSPSYQSISNRVDSAQQELSIRRERVEWFRNIKARYEISDNNMLSHLTGIKATLLDSFEDEAKEMNVNVALLLSLFFELSEDEAADLIYLSRHRLGSSLADIVLLMYLENACYDISDFVEKLAIIYKDKGKKLPKLFDTSSNSAFKKYTPYSISDCIDEDGDYRYDEILDSIRELTDLRLKARPDTLME